MTPHRFHHEAEDRLRACRVAIGLLSAALQRESRAHGELERIVADVNEATRLCEDAVALFIRMENLLTIAEWRIERLSPPLPMP